MGKILVNQPRPDLLDSLTLEIEKELERLAAELSSRGQRALQALQHLRSDRNGNGDGVISNPVAVEDGHTCPKCQRQFTGSLGLHVHMSRLHKK